MIIQRFLRNPLFDKKYFMMKMEREMILHNGFIRDLKKIKLVKEKKQMWKIQLSTNIIENYKRKEVKLAVK